MQNYSVVLAISATLSKFCFSIHSVPSGISNTIPKHEQLFQAKMTEVIKTVITQYHEIIDNQSDPRVKNWFLMSSPLPTMAICLLYLYFATIAGPKFMKTRKPYNLKSILIVYNLFQVIFNSYLFYEGSAVGWLNHYNFRCQPMDYSEKPLTIRMVKAVWWYYILKHIDLLDTIFFVLRKKNNQITSLHLIHHSLMAFSVWFGVKFAPTGHGTFFGFLNTFVHVLMYSYYLIAALGPRFKNFLWWKRYLTRIQITQFVLAIIHSSQLFFTDCEYPKVFLWVIIIHATLLLSLFYNFYETTYLKNNAKATVDQWSKRNLPFCFLPQTHLVDAEMREEHKLKKT